MSDQYAAGIRVFVYGSLKAGHGNHRVLDGAKPIGRAVLTGRYTLLDLSYYPGLVAASEIEQQDIYGEVYVVDQDGLNALDMLEGHPGYYKREKVVVQLEGGMSCKVWVYLLPDEYMTRELRHVETGMWRPMPLEQSFYERCQANEVA